MASCRDACSQGQWAFVITSPAELRPNASQRTVMRRHVMRDIGHSRRKHKTKRPSQKSLSTSSEPSVNEPDGISTATLRSLEPVAISLLPMDPESQQVLRHMFSQNLPGSLRIYRDRWYPVCVNDAAAFHQMLASYSTHLVHWRKAHRDPLEYFANLHHAKSLASVRDRLNNLHKADIEGCLSAIAALACYAHLSRDKATWKVHMSAINYIISSKNISLLHCSQSVVTLLQWVDTIGSYAFDALPSLNIPCHKPLVTLHQQQLGSKLIKLLNSMDHRHSPALVQAFHSLQSLNHHLALSYAVHGSSIWADPVGIDEMVNPTVRQFLCLCIPSEALHEDSLTWSCLRSAALLYLAELRRRSGISPVITTVQVCKLKFGVMAIEKHRFLHPTLLLWLLTIGALESITESDKSYFNCRLSCLLQELQITKLSDFRVFLNEILWFDALFDMRIKLSSLCPPD